jgi:hypothetical protein
VPAVNRIERATENAENRAHCLGIVARMVGTPVARREHRL